MELVLIPVYGIKHNVLNIFSRKPSDTVMHKHSEAEEEEKEEGKGEEGLEKEVANRSNALKISLILHNSVGLCSTLLSTFLIGNPRDREFKLSTIPELIFDCFFNWRDSNYSRLLKPASAGLHETPLLHRVLLNPGEWDQLVQTPSSCGLQSPLSTWSIPHVWSFLDFVQTRHPVLTWAGERWPWFCFFKTLKGA
jgi:hypothetical protein